MLREIRKSGAKFLPEFIKAPLRARLYGYTESHADSDFTIVQRDGADLVVINQTIQIRITDDAIEDFSFHFLNNGASVEEMTGFINAAQLKRTLFDVGAHKGLFSLVFCACHEENHAVAYEPSPVLRAASERLLDLNDFKGRINIETLAIGDTKKEIPATVDSAGFIDLSGVGPQLDLRVQMTTLDEECDRLGIVPDIIKIDIEGYEYEALKGARNLLSTKPVIFLELHLDLLEKRGLSPRDICEDLSSYGYSFYTCLGKALSAREIYDSMNAVLRFIAR